MADQIIDTETIDLRVLKEAGVVPQFARRAKVILSGEIRRKVTLTGLMASKGAKSAIEAQGGAVEAAANAPAASGQEQNRAGG